ncbi:alpha/beta fold hydrolase [Spelaeicoccus albus]|uniref:3-oxoadipate enol-lactonase n=1 Tax=Spelaeicoccus albus TaxID=1280376 RepID=A0A7Z0A9E1_9MICO|nr:alpha/beta fold hydrolase [Spelaeicoccus albus]NYI66752.1 3-oxoadipate enol-lactonase [Spelaeicoccus albus]
MTESLLLGPSLGTSTTLWSKVPALLSGDVAAWGYDIPGHGTQKPATTPLTAAALADQVVEIADGLGLDTFHFAGVSISGAVGLELALRHPGRLHTLTVICSNAKIGDADGWHDRAAQVRAQGTPSLVDGSARRWFADGFLARDPASGGRLLGELSDADDESYALLCEMLADFDVRDRLGEITVPTLVLAGEFDEVVTPGDARATADRVPGGAFTEIADAAHLAPIEQPAAVADALTDFIGGNS